MTDSLDSLRADFPSYAIHTEPRPADTDARDRQASPPGIRFVAVRREDGPGPHTVITPDPDELRTALGQPTQPVPPAREPSTGPAPRGQIIR
jgi:hypothetical protein